MSSKTFNALWAEYEPRKIRGKKTEQEVQRIYERYVAPAIGAKRVDKVTYQMIDDLHKSMRKTPYQANRVLALLRPMFRFAGSLQWIQPGYNPAKEVVMFSERKRRRHVKPSEAPRIAEVLRRRERSAPEASLFVWLLIFTGARPNEIKEARWCDLIDNKIVLTEHKSVAKTGVDRVIELPAAALEVIDKLADKSRSVDAFGEPTDLKIINLSNPSYVWRRMRHDAKCPDLRLYDLRHTFATYALEQGFTLDQIGEALAHTDPKTTKIYAEMTDRSRRRMVTDVSMAILEDMQILTDTCRRAPLGALLAHPASGRSQQRAARELETNQT